LLHPDSARNRLVGIGVISLCFLLFTLLDGTAKWLVTALFRERAVSLRAREKFIRRAGALRPLDFPCRSRFFRTMQIP
jgi:hypothetical protein